MNAFSLPLLPSLPALLPALADAALKTFVLLAVAGLVAAALRRRSAAARHLVWCAALVGALLLPVLSLALPQWQVSFLPRWPAWAQPPAAAPVIQRADLTPNVGGVPPPREDGLALSRQSSASADAALAPKTQTPSSPSWATTSQSTLAAPKLGEGGSRALQNWLALAWLTGTALALAPLLAGWWQIARITRRAAPVTDATMTALLRELCEQLGLRRAVALRHTAEVAMPVTLGAWRPVLLLPAAALGWSPERRRLVLLHELAHIARWDWPAQLAAHAACALHWFNPLAWLAARRMRLEREQACDDLVLANGAAPCDYAEELLQITSALRGPGWLALATVPMAHRSSLETRLRSILDGTRSRAALTRAAVLAALTTLALVVVPVAMLRSTEAKNSPGQPLPELALRAIHMTGREIGWAQGHNAIFRTTDGGKTWAKVGPSALHTSDRAFFYDAETAWVAKVVSKGDESEDRTSTVEVFRTSDGGRNWSHSDVPQTGTPTEVSLDFPDARTGWMMLNSYYTMNSRPGVLYRTDDGGVTWHFVTRPQDKTDSDAYLAELKGGKGELISGGEIKFRDATTGWVMGPTASTGRTLLSITRDGGRTWQLQTLPLPPSLKSGDVTVTELPRFFSPQGQDGVMGASFQSDDDGEFMNPCTVFYTTHDRGLTWQPTTPIKNGGMVWDFISSKQGWLWKLGGGGSANVAPKGELLHTKDGGNNWLPVAAGQGLQEFLHLDEYVEKIEFADDQTGWAMTMSYGEGRSGNWGGNSSIIRRVLQTTDGGQHWSDISSPDTASKNLTHAPGGSITAPVLSSLHMTDRANGWAESVKGNVAAILKTRDGGKSWDNVSPRDWGAYNSPFFRDSQTAWVATFKEGKPTNAFPFQTLVAIYRTTDGGLTWKSAVIRSAQSLIAASMSFATADKGWIMLIPDHGMGSSPGDLYRTDDGGANWQFVTSAESATDVSPADLPPDYDHLFYGGSIMFQNATTGWVSGATVSTGPGLLSITKDGGRTWRVQALPMPPSLHDGRMEAQAMPRFFPEGGKDGIMQAAFYPEPDNPRAPEACWVNYSTHDSGLTWQPVSPTKTRGGLLHFITSTAGWVWSPVAHDTDSPAPGKGTLYHTDDGGYNWVPVAAENSLQDYLTHGESISQLEFADAQTGWALIVDRRRQATAQLLQTTDGGKRWTNIGAPALPVAVALPRPNANAKPAASP